MAVAIVSGMDKLRRRLDRMPGKAKENIRAALNQNADELLNAQRALAQRNRRSGKTINSLQKDAGRHELEVIVFSDYFGARFEEFGTAKMPAIPFFFPAYRLLRKKFKTRVRSAINKSVKEAIGGG